MSETLADFQQRATDWIRESVWVLPTLWQAIAAVALLLVVALGARLIRRPLAAWLRPSADDGEREEHSWWLGVPSPLLAAVLYGFAMSAFEERGEPVWLLRICAVVAVARLIAVVAGATVQRQFWRSAVKYGAWLFALVYGVGAQGWVSDLLSAMAVSLAGVTISAQMVVEISIALVFLLWAARLVTNFVDWRLASMEQTSASIKTIVSIVTRIGAYGVAIMLAFAIAGADLSALTFFGGALGIGIGFGLQTIIANFVSGFIILWDHSLKPGDTISVDGSYGQITQIKTRYTAVTTRDGTEHLIPNEELIRNRVEAWTYKDSLVRLRIPVALAYGADVNLAMALCQDAALECARVKPEPAPKCRVTAFADSAIKLELRVWIDDPQNGTSGIKHACLLNVWNKFNEHGLEFPYPQREVHIKSLPALSQRAPEHALSADGIPLVTQPTSGPAHLPANSPSENAESIAPDSALVAAEGRDIAHELDARLTQARGIVENNTNWAAGIGVVPIPIVDLVGIIGIQIRMLRKLSALYEIPFMEHKAKNLLVSLLVGGGVVKASAFLAAGFAKAIPGIGSTLGLLAGPAVAGALTHSTGQVFISHFESGGNFLDFDPKKARAHFAAELERAQLS